MAKLEDQQRSALRNHCCCASNPVSALGGTNKGPESIVRAFEAMGRAWETKSFEIRDVVEQGDKVALFGSFTYRGRESGQEITSLFSLLAKVRDGRIYFVQFLEDTFGASGTLGRPRS